jgi:hypothetical protein
VPLADGDRDAGGRGARTAFSGDALEDVGAVSHGRVVPPGDSPVVGGGGGGDF